MKRLDRVRRIATNVRRWAEDLRKSAPRHMLWDDTLSGMCAITAYELFTRLQRAGLPAQLCYAEDEDRWAAHMFVRSCGYTVDVTATQFNSSLPPVYIKQVNRTGKRWYWEPKRATTDKEKLVKWQHDWCWRQLHPVIFSKLLRGGSNEYTMQKLSKNGSSNTERYMPDMYRSRLAAYRRAMR